MTSIFNGIARFFRQPELWLDAAIITLLLYVITEAFAR